MLTLYIIAFKTRLLLHLYKNLNNKLQICELNISNNILKTRFIRLLNQIYSRRNSDHYICFKSFLIHENGSQSEYTAKFNSGMLFFRWIRILNLDKIGVVTVTRVEVLTCFTLRLWISNYANRNSFGTLKFHDITFAVFKFTRNIWRLKVCIFRHWRYTYSIYFSFQNLSNGNRSQIYDSYFYIQ